MGKNSMECKSVMTRAQAAELLEDLARSLRQGTVCVQRDPEFVTLKPRDGMEVVLGAAQKKGKEKLEIELTWYMEVAEAPTPSGFRITAKEPEPKPEPVMEPEAETPCPTKAAEKADKGAGHDKGEPAKAPKADVKK